MDYLTVYLEILVLTFTYTAVMFFSVRREMGNDWEVNIFRTFLLTLMVAMIADAFTQAQYRGFMHMPPMLVAFLYAFYMALFSGVLPFLWFIFVEMRLGGRLLRSRKALILGLIPVCIVAFMSFASMKTGWFFSIDEYGIYTRGKLWSLQVAVNYCYFIFTTARALTAAGKETSSLQKKQYYMLSTFIIAPTIGGLLQLFIGNHPFVAPSVSIAMLFIFLNIQGNLIHNDSLTGLYNRRSAEQYIEELLTQTSSDKPFYFYKMGIDGFKEINDEYGYIEGDNVLKTVSKVLQKVTGKYGGFVARLGGVEFLAVIESKKIKDPEELEKSFKSAMNREVKRLDLPYRPTLCFGYAKCDSAESRTSDLINEADREMHQKNRSNS